MATSWIKEQDGAIAAHRAGVTLQGFRRVADRFELLTDNFGDAYLDTANRWTNVTSGGAVSEASGELQINSGTGTADSGAIKSAREFAVMEGSHLRMMARVRLPEAKVASNSREWGLLSDDRNDGYKFKMDGTQLKAVVMQNGSELKSQDIFESWDESTFENFEIRCTKGDVVFLMNGDPKLEYTSRGQTSALIYQHRMRAWLRTVNAGNNDERGLNLDSFDLDRTPNPWEGRPVLTKPVTADRQVVRGPGLLQWFIVNDGIGATLLDIYDGTGVGGTKLVGTGSTSVKQGLWSIGPAEFAKGLYVDLLSGTDAWVGYSF